MEPLIRFLRSFWQPILVALLALALLGQMVSWGYTALQMHSIDRLVEQAKLEKKKETQKDPNPRNVNPQNPRRNRGKPGKQPQADIFHRQRISYTLTAIYKDQAVINGQPVKAGGRVGKATMEEIRLASVLIHEDGQPKPRELKMFQGRGGSGGPPRMGGPRGRRGSPSAPPAVSQGSAPKTPGSASIHRRTGFGPQGMSREQMRGFAKKFRNGTLNIDELPPEMREKAREAMARREEMRRTRGDRGGRRRGGGRGPREGRRDVITEREDR